MTSGSDTILDAPAPKRRRARSRAYVSKCWEWLGSDSIRVTVKGRYRDGRAFRLRETVPWQGAEDKTIAEAEKTVALFKGECLRRRRGEGVEHTAYTLASWRDAARKGRRIPAWSRQDESVWKRWIIKRIGQADLRACDLAALGSWIRWMVAREKSPALVHKAYYLVRRVVSVAVEAGVLDRMPWAGRPRDLPAVRRVKARRAFVQAELVAVCDLAIERDAADKGDLALRLALLVDTGARPIEVAQLLASDVHLDDAGAWCRMHVAKQMRGKVKDLVRVISPALARALLARAASLPVAARETGLVFPRLLRGRWRGRWLEIQRGTVTRERRHQLLTLEELRALKLAAPGFLAYMARHTRNTRLFELGTPAQVAVAQGYAGPQSAALTSYMDRAAIARQLPASFAEPIWPVAPVAHEAPSTDLPLDQAAVVLRAVAGEKRIRVELDARENLAVVRGPGVSPLLKPLSRVCATDRRLVVGPARVLKVRGPAVGPLRGGALAPAAKGIDQLALRWCARDDDSQGERFPLETGGRVSESAACGFRFTENQGEVVTVEDPAEK